MIHEVIKKNGVTFGVIGGIISCLITAFVYAIDLNLFLNTWTLVIVVASSFILSISLLIKTKKEVQPIFSFKDAFTTYFIYAVVSLLITTLFNIILWNFIDPSAKESLEEMTIKYSVKMMQKFNAPSASINEAIKTMKENSPYDSAELVKGFFKNLVFSCIFGLILAAFFKSRSTSQE